MVSREVLFAALLLLGAITGYVVGQQHSQPLPRPKASESIRVAMPVTAQVLLAGGDRYLAANIGTFRAMMVGTENLDADGYRVLARVQQDAARLNPAQEDNYYIAQSILPWAGEVAPTQDILRRATVARPKDFLPPFFLGFDRFYFDHNPAAGADWIKLAANRSEPQNREALLNIAGRWYEKGDDPRFAIQMIEGLMQSTRNAALKQYLGLRVQRLQGLLALRAAATRFQAEKGKKPARLGELAQAGFIKQLPTDPLGQGYTLDATGQPVFITPRKPG